MIGPLDQLTIFVWRNPELGAKVQVRPDGRITTPLITDMPAAGKTPTMLQQDIKLQLSQYINDPIVSVIVNEFAGTTSSKSASSARPRKPASIPYRANMTAARRDDRGRRAVRICRWQQGAAHPPQQGHRSPAGIFACVSATC